MNNLELPVPIHEIVVLQAYLLEVFAKAGGCANNFEHSEWHLRQKYTDEEIKSIFEFFRNYGLKCDCDIIKKFDIREYSKRIVKFHD